MVKPLTWVKFKQNWSLVKKVEVRFQLDNLKGQIMAAIFA